jgi:hypothetical protein
MNRTWIAAALVAVAAGVARGQDKPSVTWRPAGHGHYRPGRSRKIDQIVIHTVEGSQSAAVSEFQHGHRKVSAHYVVGRDGSIVQCVKDTDTAWHAGSANSHAIGIEHEGRADRASTWTDALLRASARLTRYLCDKYHIPIDRKHIIGHVEVPGSDHHDPGRYFPWDRYMALVRGDGVPHHHARAAADPAAPEDGGLEVDVDAAGAHDDTAAGGDDDATGCLQAGEDEATPAEAGEAGSAPPSAPPSSPGLTSQVERASTQAGATPAPAGP